MPCQSLGMNQTYYVRGGACETCPLCLHNKTLCSCSTFLIRRQPHEQQSMCIRRAVLIHPHPTVHTRRLTDYKGTGACTSTTTQVDSCIHQSPVMNMITPATNYGRKGLCQAGQRRKRLSVHVCYVNVCMFVHFESMQECACGLYAHNCTCDWVNAYVHEKSACIRNIRPGRDVTVGPQPTPHKTTTTTTQHSSKLTPTRVWHTDHQKMVSTGTGNLVRHILVSRAQPISHNFHFISPTRYMRVR